MCTRKFPVGLKIFTLKHLYGISPWQCERTAHLHRCRQRTDLSHPSAPETNAYLTGSSALLFHGARLRHTWPFPYPLSHVDYVFSERLIRDSTESNDLSYPPMTRKPPTPLPAVPPFRNIHLVCRDTSCLPLRRIKPSCARPPRAPVVRAS